jgi:hypothetical protein
MIGGLVGLFDLAADPVGQPSGATATLDVGRYEDFGRPQKNKAPPSKAW